MLPITWVSRFVPAEPRAQGAGVERGTRMRAVLNAPSALSVGVVRAAEGAFVSAKLDTLVMYVSGQADLVRIPMEWVARFEFGGSPPNPACLRGCASPPQLRDSMGTPGY